MCYHRLMKRFILTIPEDVLTALHRKAKERGQSAAAVARGAIEREVCLPQPWPEGEGEFASGETDLGRRVGEEPARYDSSRYEA